MLTARDTQEFARETSKGFSRRVPYGAWVEALEDDSAEFYLTHSLSPHGLRLIAANEVAPRIGQPVQIRLVVENEPRVMSVQGEVVNHDPEGPESKHSFAVRFIDLDDEGRLFLTDLYDEACGF